jgi:hypothetical protein
VVSCLKVFYKKSFLKQYNKAGLYVPDVEAGRLGGIHDERAHRDVRDRGGVSLVG